MIFRLKTILFFLLFLFILAKGLTQTETTRPKAAIFIPLFLDSIFHSNGKFKYSSGSFPNFMLPGLDFYTGVKYALDSLNKEKHKADIYIYDSRSKLTPLSQQLAKAANDSVSMILAHCSASEIRTFAEAASTYKIPFINVNVPNDAGITGNPFYIILNPTLRTHCEGIYRYLQKYYALNNIIVFRKKGNMEERIKNYFEDFGKMTSSIPLNIKHVELSDSFTVKDLQPHLDTLNATVCIAGSLDESFGKNLVLQLAVLNLQNYKSIAVGMPTWENIRDFKKDEYKGIEIIYSTPFYFSGMEKLYQNISAMYRKQFQSRPGDMLFRGYEVAWKFLNLLFYYNKDLSSNITSKKYKVFTDFDIQPVLNRNQMTLDYFENKKIYILKWQDGVLKGVY
ncbi:MAG: amino acid ABC transporter substrate-binding protein [Chitinophagaceae bacterium]|nr:amino acid ABC transporter substrate-binding protein [Chitinophagaceae bacterium]